MAEVVVITGGTAGVGRAVARRFARQGAKLAFLAPRKPALTSAAVEVVSLGATAALAIPCNIDDDAQLEAATRRIEEELGPIDVWIDIAEQEARARNRRAIVAGVAGVAVALALVIWRVGRR
jgi:NAD(P)-dependent dehydrogenase (short-subunit alcohol dehydrogenase family)